MSKGTVGQVRSVQVSTIPQSVEETSTATEAKPGRALVAAPLASEVLKSEKHKDSGVGAGGGVSSEVLSLIESTLNRGVGSGTDASASGDIDVPVTFAPITAETLAAMLDGLRDPTGGAERHDLLPDNVRICPAPWLKGLGHGLGRQRDEAGEHAFGTKLHPQLPAAFFKRLREGKLDKQCHNDICSLFGSKFPLDINAFVQWVLRESYLQSTEDLYYYAEKVQYYNDVKESIRNELADMNEILAGMAGMDESAEIPSGSFSEQEFETSYVPGAESSSAAASDEELAAVAAQQAETERLKELAAQYEEDLANAPTKSKGGKKSVTVGDGTDPAGAADEWYAQIMIWWNGLTPEEQAAFEETFKSQGIVLTYDAEQDLDLYDGKETVLMTEGQSAEAFFRACADAVAASLETDFANSGDLDERPVWQGITISTDQFTAEVSDTSNVKMPQELQDIGYESGMDVEDLLEGGDGSSNVVSNKAELEAYIGELEAILNSCGDDAQLANVDLQNMLQKQQQTLQMLSNISKTLYDTAMSIVRNMNA